MFIKRLKEEQIKRFVAKVYGKNYKILSIVFKQSKSTPISEPFDFVRIVIQNTATGDTYTEMFKDFEATNKRREWLTFLYEEFGSEYKEGYIKECLKLLS